MAAPYALFQRYAPLMRALPAGELTKQDLLRLALELAREGGLAVYYAPFEYINRAARVMLVGITPGLTQMAIAHECARAGLRAEDTAEDICRRAKHTASFAGTMRAHLVRMLDGIQLHDQLGIPSCASLFDERRDLVHTTSAIRYPAFFEGANYTGGRPRIAASPMLTRYVTTVLAEELDAVPDALIIPLGKCVTAALQMLVAAGTLDPARCLVGFPHPSGGNGHREREFAERRDALRATLAGWFAGDKVPTQLRAARTAL